MLKKYEIGQIEKMNRKMNHFKKSTRKLKGRDIKYNKIGLEISRSGSGQVLYFKKKVSIL